MSTASFGRFRPASKRSSSKANASAMKCSSRLAQNSFRTHIAISPTSNSPITQFPNPKITNTMSEKSVIPSRIRSLKDLTLVADALGIVKTKIALGKAAQTNAVAELKAKTSDQAESLEKENKSLWGKVKRYIENNFQLVFPAGDHTGTIRGQVMEVARHKKPDSIVWAGEKTSEEEQVEHLRSLGLGRCIRTKEEPNLEVLAALDDEQLKKSGFKRESSYSVKATLIADRFQKETEKQPKE